MQKLSTRITTEQGVLESQESSLVPAGFLTECLNWIPEPTGGLRVRGKFFLGSDTGLPSTRANVGTGMFTRFTDPALVQITPLVQTTISAGATVSPIFSWPNPTTVGNVLVAFIALSRPGAGLITVTATGWTARQAITGGNRTQAGVYELTTTTSFQGDVTPFSFAPATVSAYLTMWMVELSGVSTFDVGASASAVSTTVAPLTSATAQESEIVLAFDATRRSASTTAFTLSTATADWTEFTESGQAAGVDYQEAAIYYGTRSATGTQTLTVTASTSVEHAAYLVAYKGWNAATSAPDQVESWLAANDDGTNIDVWAVDRADLDSGTWSMIDSNVGTSGLPVAFVLGLGRTWYTNATFSGIRAYDGVTPITVTGSPVGARCVAINHERLWAGGTPGAPSRLYFSQVAEGSTWSGTGSGYFDIARDDGEAIEDITPFAGGLVIGKRTTLTFLAGTDRTNFEPIQLNAGGAAPGRSVLATPDGCVIAGLEQVWWFDGTRVIPIGRGIEHSYGVETWVSLSYIDGSIYIADPSAGLIFVFDINAGVWHTEQVGDGAAIMYNYGDTQLYGPTSSDVASLLGFRAFPDPVRGRDEGFSETFAATTGDRWLSGPKNRVSPRRLWTQTRQRGGDAGETSLHIDATYNDGETDATKVVEPRELPFGENQAVYRDPHVFAHTGTGKQSVRLRFTHEAQDDEDVTYDVEAVALDFEASED